MRCRCWLLAFLVLPLSGQAFSWQRQVQPTGKGPQRLEVDLALLGASRADLADLRLKDAAGAEVPYVLVPPAKGEPPWLKARMLPLPATKLTSGVELDLGQAVRTGRLRLDGLKAPFLKRYRLEGSGDRQRWVELVKDASLFDLPEEGLRLLSVGFPAGEYRYLRLVWNDRSSAPVALPREAWLQRSGEAPPSPLAALGFQRRPAEPGASRFSVRLPGPGLPIRALVLEVAGEGPLLRRVKVAEPRLQEGGLAPRGLGDKQLRRSCQDEATAADLRIPMEAPQGTELELRVDDGSNAPLVLTGVKAELEPQPWIYFEAPSAAPLLALCGDPRLTRPRYDLEARRDHLTPTGTAKAQWGSALPAPSGGATVPGTLDIGPGASLDPGAFPFRRTVPAGSPGLTALVLDPHVLAHSSQLGALRLVDQGGRQIPYLLERRDEPLSLELKLSQGLAKGRTTRYALALPQAGLPGAQLVLETVARTFRRDLRVLEERAGDEARLLATGLWQHGDPETTASPLVLALPAMTTSRLILEVEEGDNQPLPLKRVQLLLPTWRLRFFQPEGPLTLCYGQDLEAPRYDLALLVERLRDAPAREVSLAPEGTPPDADRTPGMQKLFWGVLLLAVGVLLTILVRLLKAPQEEPKL